MFAPNKTWRKWTAKTNNNERRVAICSALAASAVPALLMARGHKISKLAEVPLVISNDIESITKTKEAIALLKAHKAIDDVEHAKDSKKIRKGKGKMRNRRYVMRKGPLVIYSGNNGVEQAFRNIPGVEVMSVDRLNLLKLAPGGHLGRFCIWSQVRLQFWRSTHMILSKIVEHKCITHVVLNFCTYVQMSAFCIALVFRTGSICPAMCTVLQCLPCLFAFRPKHCTCIL